MKKTFRYLKWTGKKAVVLFVLTIVLVTAIIDTTLAIIITKSGSLKSEFSVPDLDIAVMWGDQVVNVGDVPVYIRATIVANWVSKEDGTTILATAPVLNEDYTMELDHDYWFLASDGFYYDKRVILPDHPFAVQLVKSAKQLKEKEGYTLRLQIISSSIQATPIDAVKSSWTHVRVKENGELAKIEE